MGAAALLAKSVLLAGDVPQAAKQCFSLTQHVPGFRCLALTQQSRTEGQVRGRGEAVLPERAPLRDNRPAIQFRTRWVAGVHMFCVTNQTRLQQKPWGGTGGRLIQQTIQLLDLGWRQAIFAGDGTEQDRAAQRQGKHVYAVLRVGRTSFEDALKIFAIQGQAVDGGVEPIGGASLDEAFSPAYEVGCVRLARRGGHSVLFKPGPGVASHDLVDSKPCRSILGKCFSGVQQRLVPQGLHQIEGIFGAGEVGVAQQLLGVVEAKTAAKNRKRGHGPLLGGIQQVPRPSQRLAHRGLPCPMHPATLGENLQTSFDLLQQRGGGQHAGASRGQLDGQGNAIQPGGELGDDTSIRFAAGVLGADQAGAVEEEFRGLGQRPQFKDTLSLDVEDFPGGYEQAAFGGGIEPAGQDLACLGQEMLEVVEHEKRSTVRGQRAADKTSNVVDAGRRADNQIERSGGGRAHAVGVRSQSAIAIPDGSVEGGVAQAVDGTANESGLADASGAGDREQPVCGSVEALRDGIQRGLTTEEGTARRLAGVVGDSIGGDEVGNCSHRVDLLGGPDDLKAECRLAQACCAKPDRGLIRLAWTINRLCGTTVHGSWTIVAFDAEKKPPAAARLWAPRKDRNRMNRSEVLCCVAFAAFMPYGCAAGSSTSDTGVAPESDAGSATDDGGDGSGPVLDANVGCTPKSCGELGATCGSVDDGCTHLIECGTCKDGLTCGLVKANTCGSKCVPKACNDLQATCGQQGDGCGEIIECGTCTSPATCGGAGVHNTCGVAGGVDGGVCVAKSCTELGADCGAIADGCGGILECGNCLLAGQVCGANKPNVCGGATTTCAAKSCPELNATCGAANDTCGAILECGPCSVPGEVCGGNGAANVCGGVPNTCVPKDCTQVGATCGFAADGCGGVTQNCGSCATDEICGLTASNTCAKPPVCTPKNCLGLGATCGPVPDGCGGVIPDCGTCTAPQSCSGNPAKLYTCGCTGVCSQLPTCSGGATTTLTGIVKDPAGNTPLHNVLVYIPNNPQDPALQSFPSTLSCDQCGANAAGNPLVSTLSKTDGTFTLAGVPVGADVMVVIQVGRWRRQFHVAIPNACQANVATGTGQGGTTIQGGALTMPKNKAQGNIPMTSIVTAIGDNIECVFYKMGIDKAEFTNPGGGGRIEFYTNPGRGPGDAPLAGAEINNSTPDSYSLVDNLVDNLSKYDQVVLPCPGTDHVSTDPFLNYYAKLGAYANAGGRVFATHYSYLYFKAGGTSNPFYGTANWTNTPDAVTKPATALVDTDPTVNPKGADFADWLGKIGALTSASPPTLTLLEARHDVASVIAPTQQWIEYAPAGAPLHFTFNTPVGASASSQCGRVVFSDFHVVNSPPVSGYFPEAACLTAMTPQEKLLEYMIFDLASCVQPYTPGCTPTTCTAQGIECGSATDGCSNIIQCGSCALGSTCGGGGKPGKCGSSACTPKSCTEVGVECGSTGDSCGNVLACGTCTAPLACGGSGVPGICGTATCTAKSCLQLGVECGSTGDGCGKSLDCGSCLAPNVCGGSGVPGKCGTATCTPGTCTDAGVECGPVGDGCGKVIQCGSCTAPDTCGGAGVPGKCGFVTCTPAPCGTRCGKQGDGCGSVIDCPACETGTCEPTTCIAFGAKCGKIGNGCGGVIDCGACPAGSSCGGGGKPYECGGVH